MQSLLTVSTPDADDDFRNDREALQNARVVATEVRAPCSCIPPLSSKNVSSMIYESVTCKHHDVTRVHIRTTVDPFFSRTTTILIHQCSITE